ncbi:hypothetical protein CAEBREN_10784 [Caenorhabditis brenneri]|uniref:Uncharacterized protein n=1 Tax=Caenorhabditis brenneri TaxID=135651 RepID=G0NXW9_CAEBE|nr:hypothetical protein CAEBREN_10784 [Caenorhabditis brenneri]
MPTMVMSQPPKNAGDNSQRKRQKNKTDNILAVRCSYVGMNDAFNIYVRERLVYRSNVEVTYEDVYNFLTNYTNDNTISLHYSVNGSYVSITTTGQLHTFLSHVHNDASTSLYVENQELVWSFTSQDQSYKIEKRAPLENVDPTDDGKEPYNSTDDEGGDGSGGRVSEEEISSDQYEDEEGNKVLTDANAPIVFAKKVPVKEAFVEPKPRVVVKTKAQSPNEKKSGRSDGREKNDNQEHPVSATSPTRKRWTGSEAYDQIRHELTDAITNRKMGSLPDTISTQLVSIVWNPEHPRDEKVLSEAVSLMRNSVGTGVLNYYRQLKDRFGPEKTKINSSDSLEKMVLAEHTPNHDPELLVEFVDSAIIAACDSLECAQHLTNFANQFEYFCRLNNREKTAPDQQERPLPTLLEIIEHVHSILVSAHFGFNILDPVFVGDCQCKESIRLCSLEIQKVYSSLLKFQQSTCTPQQILEMKHFVFATIQKIILRFADKGCPVHTSIPHALRDSEMQKYRKELTSGYNRWVNLRENGENLLNIPLDCHGIELKRPPPFALKPENTAGDPNVVPIAKNVGDMNSATNVLNMPTHSIQSYTDSSIDMASPPKAFGEKGSKLNTSGSANENRKEGAAQTTTATTNVSATTNTVTTGQTAGGAAATISKKMSNELQKMVDAMMKNVPNQHNYVYPPPPKPGAILIPTGGLARCRCSKNCPETLMEPAYEYIERFNEPRQTVWEKTKQKRHKKN